MLVLSRKKGEGVVLYNEKTGDVLGRIDVLEARLGGDGEVVVKLGLIAPRAVAIARDELLSAEVLLEIETVYSGD